MYNAQLSSTCITVHQLTLLYFVSAFCHLILTWKLIKTQNYFLNQEQSITNTILGYLVTQDSGTCPGLHNVWWACTFEKVEQTISQNESLIFFAKWSSLSNILASPNKTSNIFIFSQKSCRTPGGSKRTLVVKPRFIALL